MKIENAEESSGVESISDSYDEMEFLSGVPIQLLYLGLGLMCLGLFVEWYFVTFLSIMMIYIYALAANGYNIQDSSDTSQTENDEVMV